MKAILTTAMVFTLAVCYSQPRPDRYSKALLKIIPYRFRQDTIKIDTTKTQIHEYEYKKPPVAKDKDRRKRQR